MACGKILIFPGKVPTQKKYTIFVQCKNMHPNIYLFLDGWSEIKNGKYKKKSIIRYLRYLIFESYWNTSRILLEYIMEYILS